MNDFLKIFNVYHKRSVLYKTDCILPIQTGCAIASELLGDDWLRDDVGDNISEKNYYYAELTAHYWVWKNVLAKYPKLAYVGFCHYRRFLDFWNPPSRYGAFAEKYSYGEFESFIPNFTENRLLDLIGDYDIILPSKTRLGPGETVASQFKDNHPANAWDIACQVVRDVFPEYADDLDALSSANELYFCMNFVMRRSLFEDCMNWNFKFLEEFEKRISLSEFKALPQPKVPAYLVERLFNVWLNREIRIRGLSVLERGSCLLCDETNRNIAEVKKKRVVGFPGFHIEKRRYDNGSKELLVQLGSLVWRFSRGKKMCHLMPMERTMEAIAEIGKGARRVCKRLPGQNLCIKYYRDDDEVGATVRREIARGRFNRRLNTCAQEYDYLQELRKKLPPEIVAVFPETFELRNDEKIGWHLVESLVLNGDGSIPQRFSVTCRAASLQVRARLLSAFRNLMHAFERAAVRFYDPQNIIVQWPGRPLEGESFRLRIVDFEPASRTLLPIDSLLPVFCRMKLRRRVKRYLLQHVQVRYNPLPWRERAAWDDHIAKEGGKIGLADCHAFLENKFVNDIFYEGLYNGLPCVVKCSSRAPESIANEYELALRLHSVDPVHFPEAFACCRGRRAFVVMEKVQGGRSLADVRAEEYSADVLAIVDALYEAKVLFRDMQPPNFLVGLDGRLKLIDFQFAMDMKSKRMDFDPWLCRHPVYHYLVFATALSRDKAHWDDAEFAMCLSPAFREALLPRLGRLRLEVSVSPFVRLLLRAQKIILLAQRVLSKKGSRKRAALDRRLGRLKW